MDIYNILSLVCAIISAFFAACSYYNQNDTKKIKKEIDDKLSIKVNSIKLLKKKNELDEIYEIISKLKNKTLGNKGDNKNVIDYYTEINLKIDSIKKEIPNVQNDILKDLESIQKILTYCINKKITIENTNRDLGYDYTVLQGYIMKILGAIDSVVSNLIL